jgi:hypothetical protein
VAFGAGLVETDDLHGLAFAFVLGDGVQCGEGGGVPDVGGGEVDTTVSESATFSNWV